MIQKIRTLLCIGITIGITIPMYPCTIHFCNDSSNPIIIQLLSQDLPTQNISPISIGANKTLSFGDKTKHTCFDVYALNKLGKRTHLCTIKQHACSMGKKITINTSDIPNNIDPLLFTIIPAHK